MLFGVTAAFINGNAAQSKLVLLKNFNENYSKCLRLMLVQSNAASEEVSTVESVSTAYVPSQDEAIRGQRDGRGCERGDLGYRLKFNSIKDAKLLLEAVEKRFGGNATTNKTQRNLLKQQYENFTAPSSEMLDQTFDSFKIFVCNANTSQSKVLHLYAVKRIFRYLKGQPKSGLWYPKDSPFDLVAYTDSDYTGVSLDRKSTTRGCQFLRYRLISWQCKKQKVVANSTTEAEYVAASSCIINIVMMEKMLRMELELMLQKVEDDKETTELKQCLEIIPDEEEVTIDAIPLAVKSLSIVG
ncbi:hypothetical protein Tco_1405351 [Tanacetum coccineum]